MILDDLDDRACLPCMYTRCDVCTIHCMLSILSLSQSDATIEVMPTACGSWRPNLQGYQYHATSVCLVCGVIKGFKVCIRRPCLPKCRCRFTVGAVEICNAGGIHPLTIVS